MSQPRFTGAWAAHA